MSGTESNLSGLKNYPSMLRQYLFVFSIRFVDSNKKLHIVMFSVQITITFMHEKEYSSL